MTITNFHQERGPRPTGPDPSDVALEASTTRERAEAVIAASWHMAEAFCGRNFWPVTAATLTGHFHLHAELLWPRCPYPVAVEVETFHRGQEWMPVDGGYLPDLGWLRFMPAGDFRVRQVGTVTPPAPGPHVLEAVRCHALYQLIHSAARREFRTQQAGDSTLTREATGPVMAASGAGALLAGEVRW